jgi:hypothetical protein
MKLIQSLLGISIIETKLLSLVQPFFLDHELAKIPEDILSQIFVCELVEDLDSFLRQCRREYSGKPRAGPHRLNDWERGWGGYGLCTNPSTSEVVPYYFKTSEFIRLGRSVVKDKTGFLELALLRCIQYVVFNSLFRSFNCNAIVEFGAGCGHNLLHLKSFLGGFSAYATDWATTGVEHMKEKGIVEGANCGILDFFKPSTYHQPEISTPYLAFTNAALEQTGKDFVPFMNYLINNRFTVGGIHIEPIRELHDLSNPLDMESLNYIKKRGYLDGFVGFLSSVKHVTIRHIKKYNLGSRFISGYQVLAWQKR